MSERPCALYRIYGQDGNLLYVGQSCMPLMRVNSHALGAAWSLDMATIKIQWFDAKQAAKDAEAKAITEEAPEWNVHFNKVKKTGRGRYDAALVATDRATWERPRVRFVVRKRRGVDAAAVSELLAKGHIKAEIARLLGVSRQRISQICASAGVERVTSGAVPVAAWVKE